MGVFSQLDFVRNNIQNIPDIKKKPAGSVGYFGHRTTRAFRLIIQEKEIIFFAILQWVTIGLAYLLWTQMLDWIPEDVWEAAAKSRKGGSAADWILLIWSFFCVGLAAYPIGILTGCMGAAHFLNKQKGDSTIASCFALVMPQSWPLWTFHWIDGWITCRRILARLPQDDKKTAAQRAREEALYYAWKIGVAGVLPSILTGNNLIKSGKNSIVFVRSNFWDVVKLRTGYSALCWIIAIATYLLGVVFLLTIGVAGDAKPSSSVYSVYLWAGLPLMGALAFVMLILRPIYVISLCDLYSDYLEANGTPPTLPKSPSKGTSALVTFGCLSLIITTVYIFRQELGIMDALANSYKQPQ